MNENIDQHSSLPTPMCHIHSSEPKYFNTKSFASLGSEVSDGNPTPLLCPRRCVESRSLQSSKNLPLR